MHGSECDPCVHPFPSQSSPLPLPSIAQGFTATAYRRRAAESRDLLALYGSEPVYAASIGTMVKGGYLADVSGFD